MNEDAMKGLRRLLEPVVGQVKGQVEQALGPVMAELRALRTENAQLRAGQDALCQELERLRAQLTRVETRIPQSLQRHGIDIDPDAIYTTGQAAKLTGLSRQTIYLKALAGELERIPSGTRAVRIKGRALIVWLTKHERTAPAPVSA